MAYSQMLRELFPEITLHNEDLLQLETFQIRDLPNRVAENEFATLLREFPVILRFLVSKYPGIDSFLSRILEENEVEDDPDLIDTHCQEALWEIADLIIYNKYPEVYDRKAPTKWVIEDIRSICSLQGKTVADVGAGSGRIAFLVAPYAHTVFAVEPLSSFRSFIKEKSKDHGVKNLYVMDGTLDAIPLPDDSLDILITSNAIGWKLEEELQEIERVVKPGGHAIHLIQAESKHEDPHGGILSSALWKYQVNRDLSENTLKIKYYKEIAVR